ncbi:hypothetical protein BKI51_10425 [Alphaproteobacteria bacterium AO1-B]|nr:hypothetical protein BKI51_10425 [Alphaproteobacteria bacterium AO1-B]
MFVCLAAGFPKHIPFSQPQALWLMPDLLRVIGRPVASMPLSHVFHVFDKTLLRRAERDLALLFGGRNLSPDTTCHDQKLLRKLP